MNDKQIVKALLDSGADANQKASAYRNDRSLIGPLSYAIERDCNGDKREIIELLKHYGANVG